MKLSQRSRGKVEALLHSSVRAAGSYKPDDVMFRIEEQLTGDEYDACHAFLTWIVKTDRGFGHNLPTVWDEWEKSS